MKFRVSGLRNDAAESITVDASDAAAARTLGVAAGLAVYDVAELGSRRSPLAAFGREAAGGGRGGGFDVDLFCEELLALLSAGITVGEALETLAAKQRSVGGAPAPRAGGVVDDLWRQVREGRPLSAALARRDDIFPTLLSASLRAAEQTSDYGPALSRFVHYRRLSREVRGKLLSAAVYPLLLLAVSSLVLLFLVGYVVPRFADVYADMGDRLPFASRVLLLVGQGIAQHGTLALAGLAVAVALLWFALSQPATRAAARGALYRVPRLRNVLAAADFARLYRTLALLLHGGVPLVTSLDMVGPLLPAQMAGRLAACRRAISEGQPFAPSMERHGLSTVVADRFFRVGERGGNLAQMIDRAAEFHEDEVSRGAEWLGRLVGPVMMLAMGTVIGVVVVLMYLPIFQLADAVQ